MVFPFGIKNSNILKPNLYPSPFIQPTNQLRTTITCTIGKLY